MNLSPGPLKSGDSRLWLRVFAFTFVSFVVIWFHFVNPRPFYIHITDVEHDYYYNIKLVNAGQPPNHLSHPGIPVYYLGAALMKFTGSGIAQTASFLHAAHALLFVLNLAVLWIFINFIAGVSLAAGIAALLAIFAWPPFLTYLDTFGADSFNFIFGMPAVMLLWSALTSSEFKTKTTAAAGAVFGLCLSAKMSFVPAACAAACAAFCHAAYLAKNRKVSWGAALVFPLALAAGFCLFTFPYTLSVLAEIVWKAAETWFLLLAKWNKWSVMPFEVIFRKVFPLAAAGLFALAGAFLLRKKAAALIFPLRKESARNLFLLLMTVFLLGISGLLFRGLIWPDMGVMFRNVWAEALCLPFLLLTVVYSKPERKKIGAVLLVLLAAVVILNTVSYFKIRGEFIRERSVQKELMDETVKPLLQKEGRLAFWDGHYRGNFGPASFHYWGNLYAWHYFDEELLREFPQLTYVYFRPVIKELVDWTQDHDESIKQMLAKYGFQWVIEKKRKYKLSDGKNFMGESKGVKISSLMISPKFDISHKSEYAELAETLKRELKPSEFRKETVGGQEWLLYEFDPPLKQK